ncbi:hypothetical protein B0F90DRAFT_1807467 [Multifurca ochricompacta]|uniref:O-fucosyltransferase family protein n=1 Tax=Multifurca ochricompacta TaxID=376703 RepID=A0AAD4MD94_9AGAM|nr:hypothetical protein B0F90DRAFT_1807467 [Multifurca ochricompacta]
MLTGLIFYMFFLSWHSPRWRRPSDWHRLPQLDPNSPEYVDPNERLLVDPKYSSFLAPTSLPTPVILDETTSPLPSSSSVSDVLTLEQIRDIVASTRGFFSRDFSLGLGWNNVRYIIDAALLQAELLNRTLVLPSFVYARACEYNITVCADYAPMVNKGDAIGWNEWRKLPIEQQMGFRIPISFVINLTHLRSRHPVVTASDYLRLHGQDPERESSSGFWPRDLYHTHPNVFETNKTKVPSLFVIENNWYDPLANDGERGYWPPTEPTDLSNRLAAAMPAGKSAMDWNTAKAIVLSSDLGVEVNIDDDTDIEGLLNTNGWEVLHTFQGAIGMDYAKTVVSPAKEVVYRSSIRGFRDDYYHVDADVIVLAGETHLYRGYALHGGARTHQICKHGRTFTIPPYNVLDLAAVLADRMRQMVGGRLWMGAHMRRGDFVRLGWVMEPTPEDHVRRVKDHLQTGRLVLEQLGNLTVYDLEGTKPDLEQTMLLPPLPDDPFFIATDERDPGALRVISDAGAVFISDLLTMEDRRTYGWPLMLTDVRALVEQTLLANSAFFYGHGMSSFAGVIINMRAVRGADPRTMLLD